MSCMVDPPVADHIMLAPYPRGIRKRLFRIRSPRQQGVVDGHGQQIGHLGMLNTSFSAACNGTLETQTEPGRRDVRFCA